MSQRDRFRAIAAENAEIFALGLYEAAEGSLVELARPGPTQRIDTAPALTGGPPQITLAAEDSLAGAERLLRGGCARVAVLNFASARSPGGGYLRGGAAQEEDLCRRSTLYPALAAQTAFYEVNRAWPNEIYADALLYTPDVQVIRDAYLMLRPDPFKIDVITAPAPNCKAISDKGLLSQLSAQIGAALALRARMILGAAPRCDGLVIGAWGCGVFGNAPQDVAAAFHAALAQGGPARVHVAIRDARSAAYAAFAAIFSA